MSLRRKSRLFRNVTRYVIGFAAAFTVREVIEGAAGLYVIAHVAYWLCLAFIVEAQAILFDREERE